MGERLGLDDLLSAIRAAGGRVTVAKRAVATTLVEATNHLSADEITRRVQSTHPDVSPSTIYRILEDLEELGVVVHAHLGHAAAVYHVVGPVHGHLVCSNCGTSIEIPARTFDGLSATLRREYGFELDRHHVALAGLCRKCRERRDA